MRDKVSNVSYEICFYGSRKTSVSSQAHTRLPIPLLILMPSFLIFLSCFSGGKSV